MAPTLPYLTIIPIPTSNNKTTEAQNTKQCRICLKGKAEIPIFGGKRHPDISVEVMEFGSISVSESDAYPKGLCGDCHKLLEGAISFRNTAKLSETLLKCPKTETPNFIKHEMIKVENDYLDYKDSILLETKKEIGSDEELTNTWEADYASLSQEVLDYENAQENIMPFLKTGSLELGKFKPNIILENNKKLKSSVKSKDPNKKLKVREKCECEICKEKIPKYKFKAHLIEKHSITSEKSSLKKECRICKKNFHPCYIVRHMKTQHPGEDHTIDQDGCPDKIECPVCKQMYATNYYYRKHRAVHTEPELKYMCEQCGKTFRKHETLNQHRFIHGSVLLYECDYCPYKGRTKGLLATHIRIHTGDYRYKCTQCNVRCLTKSNLNSHIKRHRGPIDFKCDTCNRGFYTKLDLERHVTATHLGIKKFTCDTCGARFGSKKLLSRHTLKVHKRPKSTPRANRALYIKFERGEPIDK